jgi:hypothetical protein
MFAKSIFWGCPLGAILWWGKHIFHALKRNQPIIICFPVNIWNVATKVHHLHFCNGSFSKWKGAQIRESEMIAAGWHVELYS